MLTNFDLERLANEYDIPLVHICFKDKLKDFPPPSYGGIIVNLDDSVDKFGKRNFGTHFVCVFFDKRGGGDFSGRPSVYKKGIVYFDPLGFIPPTEVMDYLNPFTPYIYNKQMIQDTRSGICGWFCLMFIKYMSIHGGHLDNRLNDFLNLFNHSNLGKNKAVVEKFFHRKSIR
jgi:hypothetical protein